MLTRRAMFAGDWKSSQSGETVLLSTKSVRFIVVGRAGFPNRLRWFRNVTGVPWMDALCWYTWGADIPHCAIERILVAWMQPVVSLSWSKLDIRLTVAEMSVQIQFNIFLLLQVITGCVRCSCAVYHSKKIMFLISLLIVFNGWRRDWLYCKHML